MSDPIYNDPAPVKIGGHEFTCRELPWRVVRQHIRDIFGAVAALKERHPEIDWGAVSGSQLVALLFSEAQNMGELAEAIASDMIIVAASTDSDTVMNLPASAYITLLGEVIKAQGPAIDAFLSLRDALKTMRDGAGKSNHGSSRPVLSRVSSGAASPGAKSGS
jgi:hypothetical protein